MQLCFMSGMTSEQGAAWVQAIGSFIAILVAVWVAKHQANKSDQLQRDIRNQQYRDIFGPPIGILTAIIRGYEKVVDEEIRQSGGRPKTAIDEAKVKICEALIDAFDAIPAHSLSSAVAVQSFMRAKELLYPVNRAFDNLLHRFASDDRWDGKLIQPFCDKLNDLNVEVQTLRAELTRLTAVG